jgi:hypothetical protein
MVALIAALAGTAVAGGVATISALNKKEKKQTRNIAGQEIDKKAPNLSVAKAKSADTAGSATASNVFGAETNDAGNITKATLAGTTGSKASNTFTIHFPRAVVDCVVTGSGLFDGSTRVVRSGTANPNDVIASNDSGTSVEVIVVCP